MLVFLKSFKSSPIVEVSGAWGKSKPLRLKVADLNGNGIECRGLGEICLERCWGRGEGGVGGAGSASGVWTGLVEDGVVKADLVVLDLVSKVAEHVGGHETVDEVCRGGKEEFCGAFCDLAVGIVFENVSIVGVSRKHN